MKPSRYQQTHLCVWLQQQQQSRKHDPPLFSCNFCCGSFRLVAVTHTSPRSLLLFFSSSWTAGSTLSALSGSKLAKKPSLLLQQVEEGSTASSTRLAGLHQVIKQRHLSLRSVGGPRGSNFACAGCLDHGHGHGLQSKSRPSSVIFSPITCVSTSRLA